MLYSCINILLKQYKPISNIFTIMYRLIPLRMLRRTAGVVFDEMVPSDIPKIDGIDKVIHSANSISPGPVED